MKLEKGISAVIATYNGKDYIHYLLDSLEKQSLDKKLYELIFVVNGVQTDTINDIMTFIKKNNEVDVKLAYTKTANMSTAYNLGIRIAEKERITFIDDDDFVSEKYLERLYIHSKPNRVVMANFKDVTYEEREIIESPLFPWDTTEFGLIDDALYKFKSLTSITSAKSLPTDIVKKEPFDSDLINGQDIIFYTNLYSKYDFEFFLIPEKYDAVYYRVRRPNSMSRKKYSYYFNVETKFIVLNKLNEIRRNNKRKEYEEYIDTRIRAQASFIKTYIDMFPDEKEKCFKEINNRNYDYFPYEIFE